MNERMRQLASSIPVIGGAQHALLPEREGVHKPCGWRATPATTIVGWIEWMRDREGIASVEHVPKEDILWEDLDGAEAFALVGERGWRLLVAVKEG